MNLPLPKSIRGGFLAGLALTGGLLAGCAASGDGVAPLVQGAPSQLNLLSKRDVQATPAGSPARTILVWWRDMQYAIASRALALFAKSAQAQLRREPFTALVYEDFGPWSAHARPEILAVTTTGPYAIARIRLQIKTSLQTENLVGTTYQLLELPLIHQRAGWRLEDADFFQAEVLTLERARELAQKISNAA